MTTCGLREEQIPWDGALAASSRYARVQFAPDARARKGCVCDQGQAFVREVIADRQDAAAAAIGQGVADEVQAPAVIRGLRDGRLATCPPGPFANLQMLFAV